MYRDIKGYYGIKTSPAKEYQVLIEMFLAGQ